MQEISYLCSEIVKTTLMAIEIREVKTPRELKHFVQFCNDLYKDCENFCPRMMADELMTLTPATNPASEVCEQVLYLAYEDGKIVGRICGIINHAANERWRTKAVRFGWIDFIDDERVSFALLDAVAAWGKSKGCTHLNGPLGFTDWDYEGLLIEGFEYLAPVASLYNYPYYQKHLEDYGMRKDNDWIEFQIAPPYTIPERMQRLATIVEERSKVHIDPVRSRKELVRKYGLEFMDVLDGAYQKLYNYQPMTQRQKEFYRDHYFPLVNFDFVSIVVNDKNEIVGVGVGMPDISKAVKKCNGKLFPFGWFHILRALKAKKIEAFDLLLIAVRPDYQGKGVNSLIFMKQLANFTKYGIQRVETTSMIETNFLVQDNFKLFNYKQHKRRRAYIKEIE